ncbi:sarcosine oxidase subunit delta [Xanthobacter sp. TB0136]|uniref:sarcosine oxidase subunit delta n=1 Tax=Xanthobacter sp. TB0136 TaxID=3459177 RepID=UPI00403A5FB3
MRIPCPYCGSRDLREFTYQGDAEATGDAFERTYLRTNPFGRHKGWWYHDNGCRSWLLVERDTRTHEIHSVTLARNVPARKEAV